MTTTPEQPRALRRARLAVAIAVLTWACACTSSPQTDRPNLLLIVVDTLRADHLGCYGHARKTPAIDALAARSIRFERAYSTAPWTKPAIASMMTGLYPSHHGVDRMLRVLPGSALTLAERLGDSGYRTAGVVSHSLLGKKFGFDQGFETYDESQARGHGYISTKKVVRRAEALVADFAEASEPFFLFVHLFDPHDTYRPHPDIDFAAEQAGRIRAGQPSPKLRKLDPPLDPQEVGLVRDLYDEEIHFTDRGIGSLLNTLQERGVLENTMVVLTSDHGEEFLERGWLGHGTSMFDELLRVPLLVRLPKDERAGEVVPSPVSLTGLAATVLDTLRIDYTPDDVDTGSFLSNGGRGVVHAELNYAPGETGKTIPPADDPWLRAVIEGDYKLTYDRLEDRARLYDLRNDPGETNDLAPAMPQRAARMKTVLRNGPSPQSNRRLQRATTNLTEAQKEMLRKLGYGE